MNKTNVTLPVKGMDCASCALSIEKILKKVPGVISCEVNYGNEKVKLNFNSAQTNLTELNEKITPLGYSFANLEETGEMKSHEHQHHQTGGIDHSEHLGLNQTKQEKLKELESMRKKVLFIFPLALVVFFFMFWEIAMGSIQNFPAFPFPEEIYRKILLVLAAISLFWIGKDFLKEVLIFIKYRVANMYSLVGIGTLTAFTYSAIVTLFPEIISSFKLPSTTYFDVTIVVIGFIFLGKYLESRSKLKTGEAIEKLLNLQAKNAIMLHEDGKEHEIPISDVRVGYILLVKPGAKVPVDGIITEGFSAIDESMITGEPIPVDKKIGDLVIGGTINENGLIQMKATKVGSDTLLAQIIKLVDEAQGSKAPIQKLADQISAIFVPTVLIISLVSLLAWLIIAPNFMPFDQAFSYGILSFVSVLVIACPCALGLATPTGIIVGVGKGAENGILIKNAESLEKLHSVTTVVTDKTGTLTSGKPTVTDVIALNKGDEDEILRIAASLESGSDHPIAKAIIQKSKEKNLSLSKIIDFSSTPGLGVTGVIAGVKYSLGNEKLVQIKDSEEVKILTKEGKTLVLLTKNDSFIGVIGIYDTIKPGVKEAIEELHKQKISIVMLTGDHQAAADKIGSDLGIDRVIANILPAEKSQMVKSIQESNNKSVVAYVGDGINDAPALAQSDIGIAMGTGTDVAIETSAITLLGGDFTKVNKAIHLSKATMRTIKQNLFWAFIYNIIGIPIASGLFFPFFGLLLNPAFAGMAMALSSVSVVLNSLKLKLSKL